MYSVFGSVSLYPQYMVAELLEVAGEAAKDNNKKTIKPRHIMLAARQVHQSMIHSVFPFYRFFSLFVRAVNQFHFPSLPMHRTMN